MPRHEQPSTSLTHAAVQAWLDAYAHAWETYDRAEIEALWSDDAEYRWHPADEPTVGRDAIVDAWLNPGGSADGRDDAGTYEGRYEPYAVDGSRAVAIGTSTYWTDATRSTLSRLWYNCWLLEFDTDGRCRSFTEYWILPRGA